MSRTATRNPHAALVLLLALGAGGCDPPDPKQHLELVSHEFYWTVVSTSGQTSFIAPAARIEVRNLRDEQSLAIQATATFKRVAEEDGGATWGTSWTQIAGGEDRLAPGETRLVVLQSDARYYSTGSPEQFFEHELFRDATVEVFLRVGSSPWESFAAGLVARRFGTESVVLGPP